MLTFNPYPRMRHALPVIGGGMGEGDQGLMMWLRYISDSNCASSSAQLPPTAFATAPGTRLWVTSQTPATNPQLTSDFTHPRWKPEWMCWDAIATPHAFGVVVDVAEADI
jgi:hypothetical protein